MSKIVFDRVEMSATKRMRCDGCGKLVTRRETRWQSLNPYNRNAEGHPKTGSEIQVELKRELAIWKAFPVVCKACATAGRLWHVRFVAGEYIVRPSDSYHSYIGKAYPTENEDVQLAFVVADTEADAKRLAANLFFGAAS